jgi:hypothetical protein
VPGLTQDADSLLVDAQAVGPATVEIVQGLLNDPVLYRIPTAGRLVRLKNRFGEQRLEAACQRALTFNDLSYKTVKRILEQGLDQEAAPIPVTLPAATTFARSTAELVGELTEVAAWT